MAINTLKYITNFEMIRTKDKGLQPFIPNPPQMRLYNAIKRQAEMKKPIRIIILKARQMGFSTMTGGIIFKITATTKFTQSAIITHLSDTTKRLFEMYQTFNDYLPDSLKPAVKASNSTELIFSDRNDPKLGLNSKIICKTATDEGVGRGETNQNIHMSEYAFWKNPQPVFMSLMQSVPDSPNTMVIIESTANGYNDFKDMWDAAVAGENDFEPLFFAWFEMPTYRMPYTGWTDFTEEELELKRKFNVDNEQLSWRRYKIKNNFKGKVEGFHQEFPSTPEEAFLFSGNSYFDMQSLKSAKEISEKPKCGYFKYDEDMNKMPINIQWVDDPNGIIRIFRKSSKIEPYVIGGDTAGEGSDAFIGQVLENISGEQAAVLEYNGADELYYAQQMYCLGLMYNRALLAIETNFSTYPQRKLEEWDYRKFFQRETFDTYTNKPKASFGFRTDTISRPAILANLQSIVKDNYQLIHDYKTITEMETFVKNEKGKPEAMNGSHDDHVMALAIAYHARGQQEFKHYSQEKEVYKSNLPFALMDDEYNNEEGDYIWN